MQSSWTPGGVWVALRLPKFLPLRSLQNSEASQRCIWQLGTATSRWSNRSSRPRPPWTRTTTNMALASDRGFGGNPPEAWDEMLANFFEEVFHNFFGIPKHLALILCVVLLWWRPTTIERNFRLYRFLQLDLLFGKNAIFRVGLVFDRRFQGGSKSFWLPTWLTWFQ